MKFDIADVMHILTSERLNNENAYFKYSKGPYIDEKL